MKKLILFFLLGLFHLSIPAADESSAECDAGGRLVLPKIIYAVPGVEANLYFRNVFLCINPDNYVFDVDCSRGRNDRKRWRFLPAEGDAGSYPLTLSVYDEKGLVARGKTVVRVIPRDAGNELHMKAAPGKVVVRAERKDLRLSCVPIVRGGMDDLLDIADERRPPDAGIILWTPLATDRLRIECSVRIDPSACAVFRHTLDELW